MLAFRLLRHSILQLTGNLGAALTLSVLPLLLAALGIGIGMAARQALAVGDPPGIIVAVVAVAIVATFVLAFVSLAASGIVTSSWGNARRSFAASEVPRRAISGRRSG